MPREDDSGRVEIYVFGGSDPLDPEDVRRVMEVFARGEFGDGAQRQEFIDDDFSLRELVLMVLGALRIKVLSRVITAFPLVANLLARQYSSTTCESIGLGEVLERLGGDEHRIAKGIVDRVNQIRQARKYDPNFLLDDEDMEYLRMALFLFESFKLSDKMFCEFGQGVISDVRTYVRDFEISLTA